MTNILPHAYSSEVVYLVVSGVAFTLVMWMTISTWLDLKRYETYLKSPEGRLVAMPRSFNSQAHGNFKAELWRLAETIGLFSVAVWAVFWHSIDSYPVLFWDLNENVRPDRILAIYLSGCKMMAAWTARWYRHLADVEDE